MRVATGTSLLLLAAKGLPSSPQAVYWALFLLTLSVAALLLVGLWTPVAGVGAAVVAGWHGATQPQDPSFGILLAVVGIALALLGPGAWSVDARLFGWKRLELQDRAAVDSAPGTGPDSSS